MHYLTKKAVIALGVLTAMAMIQFLIFGNVSWVIPALIVTIAGIVFIVYAIDIYGDFAKMVEQFNRTHRYRTSFGRRAFKITICLSAAFLFFAIYKDVYWARIVGYKLAFTAPLLWLLFNNLPFACGFYFARKKQARLN